MGSQWLHYKGKKVEVEGLYLDEEKATMLVAYREVATGDKVVRSAESFMGVIGLAAQERSQVVQRFTPSLEEKDVDGNEHEVLPIPRSGQRGWREELLFRINGGTRTYFDRETFAIQQSLRHMRKLEQASQDALDVMREVSASLDTLYNVPGVNQEERGRLARRLLEVRGELHRVLQDGLFGSKPI